MKIKFAFLLAAALTAAPAWAGTVLPDACGSDKVKFDVTDPATTDAAAGNTPAEGKARVIFIETVINTGYLFGAGPHSTTRFGVDGAWVGAADNNSYFTLDLAPGMHHFCTAVQGTFSAPKDKIGIMSFNAEAGKVYYVDYMLTNKNGGHTSMVVGGRPGAAGGTVYTPHTDSSNGLLLLDEDDGKFRVKSSKLKTSTIQK